MKVVSILAAGSLFVAGAAVAQDVPPAAGNQAEAAPQAAQPAPAPAPATSVSDAEVDQFVLAALKIEKIAGDEALDQTQKQASMASAVQETGLEPQRFNQIAMALQKDQALNERVQMAAAKQAQPAQPAEPSSAPAQQPTEEPEPKMSE
ncbi:DUF4168 domain-containing protein [Parasphingorhabdus sp.]|uniref:DUF4168 domain-containing protein n=1 Tax=Parasphingorhabdus sp. TaxID=2709688 RepID=UPI002F91DA26